MNIAFVIYDTLDTVSGSYLYDRKLVEHLRAQGHTVEIVSLPRRTYRLHLQDNFSAELLSRLVTGNFDLILQDEMVHPSVAWLNRQVKKQVQTPIISVVHHLRSKQEWGLFHGMVIRRVEKDYLKTIDGFVFNSDTTRKAVEGLLGDKRPSIVSNPAADHFKEDLEAFTTGRNNQTGKLRIIFVGNIIERKGLDVLLMGLKQVPVNKWELDIVGDPTVAPDYVAKLHQLIEETPRLKPAVHFLGPLSQRQLAIRYSMNHVLIVPSTYEGFGIVYLEGMGFGLPAVATSAGAASEIITHLENGFLLSVNNPKKITEAVKLLIKDRKFLAEMSENALKTFNSFPGWDETCHKTEGFLLELIN